MRERDHLKDLDTDGTIILKLTFKTFGMEPWTEIVWISIWTGVGYL
jgi:hypothetical protein